MASQLALETLEAGFEGGRGSLVDLVEDANRAVFARSGEDRAVQGMGTTLTAAVVRPDGLELVHVGDSRAYLLRGGALRLLTEDHTLVNRMHPHRQRSARRRPRSTPTATCCCARSGPSPT